MLWLVLAIALKPCIGKVSVYARQNKHFAFAREVIMSGILNRINLMISRYLSNRLLMREQGLLLGVMACMLTAGAFSAAFINVFLYEFANSVNYDGLYAVARYNMLSAVFMMIFCIVAGIIVKRITYKLSMTAGAVIHIIFYAYIIMFASKLQEHITFMAMLSGMSTAFFYLAYNSLIDVMVGNVSKKQYIMFQSIISMAVGIVFPLVSGVLVFALKAAAGYITVFVICILLCLACMVLCIMLPEVPGQSRKTFFAGVLIKSYISKSYRAASVNDCMRGIKEGILMFLLPVVIIRTTENAFVVGLYVSVCTVAGILGNLSLQKFDVMKYPYIKMLFAILVQSAVAAVLVFKLNIYVIFIFGIINAFFGPMSMAPVNVQYYKALEVAGTNLNKKTLETSCVKEIHYNFGKIIAILLLGVSIANTAGMFMLISVFFVLQVVTWINCVSARKAEDSGQ